MCEFVKLKERIIIHNKISGKNVKITSISTRITYMYHNSVHYWPCTWYMMHPRGLLQNKQNGKLSIMCIFSKREIRLVKFVKSPQKTINCWSILPSKIEWLVVPPGPTITGQDSLCINRCELTMILLTNYVF